MREGNPPDDPAGPEGGVEAGEARVRVSLGADVMDEAGQIVAEALGVRCLALVHYDDAIAFVAVNVSREDALALIAEALRKLAVEVGRPLAIIPLTGGGPPGRTTKRA